MHKLVNRFIPGILFLATSLTMGCTGGGPPVSSERCLVAPAVDASAPITHMEVQFMAGTSPLVFGQEVTTTNGARLKPTKARFYLSQLTLIGEGGARVSAELVDASGNRLPYGATLVDMEQPESLDVHIQAPAGSYQGLSVSVGVPESCPSGEMLNHSDASAMNPPLDVDSDMYWSWNSGYVFLKFEGQVWDSTRWDGFFYHVGEDRRLATLELQMPFTISSQGGEGPALVADFNRLLTSATGTSQPDVTDSTQRRVHGGSLADALAGNIRTSGFLRLEHHDN
jgi:hypothetical protein